jgi:hypothetical protein
MISNICIKVHLKDNFEICLLGYTSSQILRNEYLTVWDLFGGQHYIRFRFFTCLHWFPLACSGTGFVWMRLEQRQWFDWCIFSQAGRRHTRRAWNPRDWCCSAAAYIYIHIRGARGLWPPTPQGRVSLDPSLKLMISVNIPCYVAPSETFTSGGVLGRGFLTEVDGFLMECLLERVS